MKTFNIKQKIGYEPKRFIIIGDVHYGIHSNSKKWLSILNDYFDNYLIPFIKKHKKEGDVILQLGDLFDNRQSLNLLVLHEARKRIEKLAKELPILSIIGNHDIYGVDSNEVNSFWAINDIENFHWFMEPTQLTINNDNVLLLPWSDIDTERKLMENDDFQWVFSHTEALNAFLNNSKTKNYSGHTLEFINRFKGFFSGHIHYQQNFENVYFIGSVAEFTRSDAFNDKGVYILDFENEKIDFHVNGYSPKFKNIYISDIMEWTVKDFKDFIRNNLVDFYITPELMTPNLSNFIRNVKTEAIELNPIYIEENYYDDGSDYFEDKEESEKDEKEFNFDVLDICHYLIDKKFEDSEYNKKLKSEIENIYQKVQENDKLF